MTSALNKFEIMRKDNKWKSMSPEPYQITALSSVGEKLKDNKLKLSKIFNTSPPGKGKGRGNGKVKDKSKKPAGKQP